MRVGCQTLARVATLTINSLQLLSSFDQAFTTCLQFSKKLHIFMYVMLLTTSTFTLLLIILYLATIDCELEISMRL